VQKEKAELQILLSAERCSVGLLAHRPFSRLCARAFSFFLSALGQQYFLAIFFLVRLPLATCQCLWIRRIGGLVK